MSKKLDRAEIAAKDLFDALMGHYRKALVSGRQKQWAAAAHSIVDLLADEKADHDTWLQWLVDNHQACK